MRPSGRLSASLAAHKLSIARYGLRGAASTPSASRRCMSTGDVRSSSHGAASSVSSQSMDLGRHFYLNKVLEQYAAKPATRMTLRQLVFFGKTLGRDPEKILKVRRTSCERILPLAPSLTLTRSPLSSQHQSANYVRQELAVRIAHRIRDLQALPFVVMTNKNLEAVYEKYWTAFETFRKIPTIRTMEDNEKFCTILKSLLDDHLTIIPSLTIGIVESSQHLESAALDSFMERMLRSRISRRVLAEQHIALSEALDDPFHFFNEPATEGPGADVSPAGDGEHVGIIYTNLKVSSVVEKGIHLLRRMFEHEIETGQRTGDAAIIPDVVVDGALEARFAYIPEHLEYIIFELLKNSMMAVMRRPVAMRDTISMRVTIVEGPPDEDLIIRISDCGGGLPDLVSKLSRQRKGRTSSQVSRRNRRESTQVIDDIVNDHSRDDERRKPAAAASGRAPETTMDSNLKDDYLFSRHFPPASEEDTLVHPTAHPKSRTAGARAGNAGMRDSLITAVTSFSNVKRRLEIEEEEEVKRVAATSQASSSEVSSDPDSEEGASQYNHIQESPGKEKEGLTQGLRASIDSGHSAGLDSRDKMEALKSVGRFKGTVAEQVTRHHRQRRRGHTSAEPASTESQDAQAAPATPPKPSWAPRGDDGTAAAVTKAETGLGLPMTKIYADFFGGSLNLRSLDG